MQLSIDFWPYTCAAIHAAYVKFLLGSGGAEHIDALKNVFVAKIYTCVNNKSEGFTKENVQIQ